MDAVCAAVALLNRKKKLRNEAKAKRDGHKTSTDTNVTPSEGTSSNTTSSDAPRFYFHNWIVNGQTTRANSPAPKNDNSNGTLNQDCAQGDDGKQKYSNGTKEADAIDKTSSFSFLQFFRDRVWFKSSDKPTESPDDAVVDSNSNAKITDECIKQEAAKRFTDFYIDSYEECFILADADMPVSMLIAMSSCNRKKSNDTKPVDSESPATKLEEFKPNDQRDAKLHETKPEPENSKLHDTNPNDTKLKGAGPSKPNGDETNDSKLNGTGPKATKAVSDKTNDSKPNGTGPKATKAVSDKTNDSMLNGTGPKATKAMSDKTNDSKLNGTGPNATKAMSDKTNDRKLNGTGPNATKDMSDKTNGSKLNSTGPKATKAMSDKTNGSMLNDTGTKAYHLKLESDELKKSKPNDQPNKPTKSNDKMSKDPKDSKEVKSETNRGRIFSLNDVRYGRTVEKQPGHTRSKHPLFQTFEKKRNSTPDEEKCISEKTRGKWRCEWENFKYLWKIGNSRMITKNFHKDLELYPCKVEDEDTEKPDTEAHDTEVVNTEAQDTKDANTEVVNTEAHDTEAQDTEVVNTEAQDTVNTEAQDTKVVNTEAQDTEVAATEALNTEVVNTEAQDTKVFNPGALYNEALKCNPFNTTCIVEVLKSNGINLFFDRPLAEVYKDFVRMQEKPEEPKHEVPFPEPIGTFDNPGHGPMEVAYNVQESIVEQIARNNNMDSQASVAQDRDLDTQGFLSFFARPNTSQHVKRNLTTFIRSYNVDKTPSFEVVEYDDRGYELRVHSSNDQQGVFWLQVVVTDNTGKTEQCSMTWKSVPATGNRLHRQECIQCSVRDPKGQETVLLGDEGAKLYYRFKTSNAWATNVGYSYSVDKIF